MIFCLSIDLDPLSSYREIFGLPPGEEHDPVATVALPRFSRLLSDLGGKGTVFAVGRCLEDPRAAAAIAEVSRQGHEVGNHTFSHPYRFSLLPEDELGGEIRLGADAVEKACGRRPAGFRAPGYLLGTRVLPALIAAGVRYDSSLLPSPIYQGVKAAYLGWLKLCGRRSSARLGDPREAFAPRRPYRPDPFRPYREGISPLLELPVSTVLGGPLTGAALAFAGPARSGMLAALAARSGFVNLELHGIDLMDIESDGLDPALGVQRDLRIPWQRKAEAFSVFVERLHRSHRMMTLEEAAGLLG